MGVTSARQVLVGSHKTLDISSCSSLLPSPAFWLPPPWPHPPVRSSPSRSQSAQSLLRKSSPRAAFQRQRRSVTPRMSSKRWSSLRRSARTSPQRSAPRPSSTRGRLRPRSLLQSLDTTVRIPTSFELTKDSLMEKYLYLNHFVWH